MELWSLAGSSSAQQEKVDAAHWKSGMYRVHVAKYTESGIALKDESANAIIINRAVTYRNATRGPE